MLPAKCLAFHVQAFHVSQTVRGLAKNACQRYQKNSYFQKNSKTWGVHAFLVVLSFFGLKSAPPGAHIPSFSPQVYIFIYIYTSLTIMFSYIHIHFSDYHVFIANLYEFVLFVLNSIAVCPVFSSLWGNYLMILNGVGDICEKSFQLSNQNKSPSNSRVFFSMTKVNHPNHPCWTIFSLKMLLYAKFLWMWLYVWQPQNKTQALPVISAARKHVRLQQCWWWWFVITDLRAGRLWSPVTSMECSMVTDPKDP